MKITDLKTYICHAYRTNWVFVKIFTDAGIEGVGEATLEMREQTVAQAIHELGRSLIGHDPHRIEAFWHDAGRTPKVRSLAIPKLSLAQFGPLIF